MFVGLKFKKDFFFSFKSFFFLIGHFFFKIQVIEIRLISFTTIQNQDTQFNKKCTRYLIIGYILCIL